MGALTKSLPIFQSLFDEQQKSIQFFYEQLDYSEVEQVFRACLACKGMIALSGVGKSGIVAEKIARTLLSTGTRALFLPPVNFLHGDIGTIQEGDILLLFSKSGRTTELLSMIQPAQRRGGIVIGIGSEKGSPLEEKANLSILLPVLRELCPFNLAPTTSTAVQLLFGDALSIYLMKEKGFSLDEYGESHPAGAIGKKIVDRVSDLMLSGDKIPLCGPEEKLVDILVELSRKQCGCILVHERGKLLGIFTDGDLRRALEKEGSGVLSTKIGKLMTLDPITAFPEERAASAAARMQENRYVMVAPVVEKNKIVGLLRLHDIIQQGL